MVLHKFLLEPYLNNRLYSGLAQGKARGSEKADEEWRPWYNRMKEAEARGEEFNELPPGSDNPQTKD